jgi:hypothetical protein
MADTLKSANNAATPESAPRSRERRREPRVRVAIEIEVSGIDPSGRPFREVTRTIEVSEWGCSFRLGVQVEMNALLALHPMGKQRYCLPAPSPVMFQVNYSKQESGLWIVGASKMQRERLWDVDAMGSLPRN